MASLPVLYTPVMLLPPQAFAFLVSSEMFNRLTLPLLSFGLCSSMLLLGVTSQYQKGISYQSSLFHNTLTLLYLLCTTSVYLIASSLKHKFSESRSAVH